jgi:hypothetical protein
MKYLKILLITAFLISSTAMPARADLPPTFSGGAVTGSLVLGVSGSPYRITSSIDIPAGSALTISPGVEIISSAPTLFRVQGVLDISGSEKAPVRISSSGRFIETIQTITDEASQGFSMRHTELNGGSQWSVDTMSLAIEDSDILNQTCSGANEIAVRSPSASFRGNFIQGACGFSLDVNFGVFGPRNQFTMQNNLFSGNPKSGFWISASSLWEDRLELVNNSFINLTSTALKPGFFETQVLADSNYWGGLSLDRVRDLAIGSKGSVFAPPSIQLNTLSSASHPMTPTKAHFATPVTQPSDSVAHMAGHGPSDGDFSAWTKVLAGGSQMKFYAKYLQPGQKVQFMVQDSDGVYQQFAWKRITSADLGPEGQYTNLQNHVYFIRTFDLKPGKNRVRIYVDGQLVWGTKTYTR